MENRFYVKWINESAKNCTHRSEMYETVKAANGGSVSFRNLAKEAALYMSCGVGDVDMIVFRRKADFEAAWQDYQERRRVFEGIGKRPFRNAVFE